MMLLKPYASLILLLLSLNNCSKGHKMNLSTSCFWSFCEGRAGTVPPTRCIHSTLNFLFSWVTAGLWGCPPAGVWAAPALPLWLDGAKTPRWLRRSASEEVHTQVGIQLPAISGHSLFVVRAAVLQLYTFLLLFLPGKLFLATTLRIFQLERRHSRTPGCKALPLV